MRSAQLPSAMSRWQWLSTTGCGRASGAGGRSRSRTAYLHVNYRQIAPVDQELQVDAAIDRIEGRKIFVSGRLLDGDAVLCDAEALFVRLKPGQP